MDSLSSSPSFFTLGLLVGEVPKSLWRCHLYTVQDLGIHRVVTDVPTSWAGRDVSSRFLSHSLYRGIFVWCPNSKPSPALGQVPVLLFMLSLLTSDSYCGGLPYGNILLWQWNRLSCWQKCRNQIIQILGQCNWLGNGGKNRTWEEFQLSFLFLVRISMLMSLSLSLCHSHTVVFCEVTWL